MSPEHRLWGAVLMRGIEDALGNVSGLNGNSANVIGLETRRSEEWVGGKDFAIVCSLAGFDPTALAERLRPVLRLPIKERHAWWRRQLAESCGPYRHYTGTCRAPGCRGPVSRNSKTGLCREHAHADGVCECGYCRRHKSGKWAVKA